MHATENNPAALAGKLDAFGLKAIAEAARCDLVTVYRWRKALKTGRGVIDDVKLTLIEVTAGTPQAISWADFDPRPTTAAQLA